MSMFCAKCYNWFAYTTRSERVCGWTLCHRLDPPGHRDLRNEPHQHLNIGFEGKLTSDCDALLELNPSYAIAGILRDQCEDDANHGPLIVKYNLLLMSSGLLTIIQILTGSSLAGGSCLMCSSTSVDMVGDKEQLLTLCLDIIVG